MLLPHELWPQAADFELVRQAADLFADAPLVLTDRLANSVFFNDSAEALFADRAEAIVNRAAFSLLGFGDAAKAPEALAQALLGEGPPWRSVVRIGERPAFCEASAIRRAGHFVCGIVRISGT